MTIDEKLQHFMDVTTEKGQCRKCQTDPREYEQGLERVYRDYKETALAQIPSLH